MDAGVHDEANMRYQELRARVDLAEADSSEEVDLEIEEHALYIRLAKGAIAEAAFRRSMRLQGRRA